MNDPWVDARYSSSEEGAATFSSYVEMGTVDLEGRAFLVHAEDGSRVGCGILTKVEDPLTADLAPLGDSMAMGSVSAVQLNGDSDTICYMGYAMNLEAGLSAFYAPAAGPDCTAKNGCGTHVHAGTSCESSETQKGHYYSGESDPWAIVGYDMTDAAGFANYVDCISTGETEFEGKAFIVHANDGSRVACGLLGDSTPLEEPSGAPVVPPTDAPVAAATDAPVADPTAAPSAGNAASIVVALATSVVGLWATLA